jgi:replicative DNA helicase
MLNPSPPRRPQPPLRVQPKDAAPDVPYNILAEEAVLGSILLDSQAIIEIAAFLLPQDFYREHHGWVYSAALALMERHEAIDNLTVGDELRRRGKLDEVGDMSFLTSLINAVPTAIHIVHYGRIVERCAIRRRLLKAVEEIAMLTYEEELETNVLLDKAEETLRGVSRVSSSDGFHTSADIIDAMQTEMWSDDTGVTPLPMGLAELDNILGGLMPKELTVVAGRTGMGKTSFLDTLAFNFLQAGEGVAFVSLEMTKEAIMNRMRRMLTGLPAHRLRLKGRLLRQDEIDAITGADGWLYSHRLDISEKRGLTITQIRRLCRQWYARRPFKVLLVDYIQNIRADNWTGNQHTTLTEVMLGLYELASELGEHGIHVIAASQLNRDSEKRSKDENKPQLSDLRESGKIEETANNVIGLWRPEYYAPPPVNANGLDATPTQSAASPSVAIVLKQREGRTGEVQLGWWGERSMFINLADVRRINGGQP